MSASGCPFCQAGPGQAITATESQALAHSGHVQVAKPQHHKGYWTPDGGICQCECPRCWVEASCVCPDCTASDSHHDHSRRQSVTATSSLTSDGGPS